ncbi:hypothetical protein BDZ91DRAFT_762410 [Kalaharituber pfeilii]|nr:hypothetical protein BDZ91DRAFT_762410 [Kalaharituber pfeilii]
MLGENHPTPALFPNLKIFHLGGRYEHLPRVFDHLPILEKLTVTVEFRIEYNYNGGITKYLRKKGMGLKRLGLKFQRVPRISKANEQNYRLWQSTEHALLECVKNSCSNLEEIGLWNTSSPFVENALPGLPQLRAISFNSQLPNFGVDAYSPTPLPEGLSAVLRIYNHVLRAREQLFPGARGPTKLKYIKLNLDAWEVFRPQGDSMNTRFWRLSRTHLDIPAIFLVEDLEGLAHCWATEGTKESNAKSRTARPP